MRCGSPTSCYNGHDADTELGLSCARTDRHACLHRRPLAANTNHARLHPCDGSTYVLRNRRLDPVKRLAQDGSGRALPAPFASRTLHPLPYRQTRRNTGDNPITVVVADKKKRPSMQILSWLSKIEALQAGQEKSPKPAWLGAFYWWASRESNTAPTDYESAALTKHELEALKTDCLH